MIDFSDVSCFISIRRQIGKMKFISPNLIAATSMMGLRSLSPTAAFVLPRHPASALGRSSTSLSMSSSSSSSPASVLVGPELPPIPATAKRLFLVRHGEVIPPGGVHGVLYGAMDVPLSPLGEAEAVAAARYLSQFDLEIVASSPLKRAVYGADQTLRAQSNLEPSDMDVYDGFRELDRGAWCGLKREEIGEENMERFNACDESVTPEGGESVMFVRNRVTRARDELLSKMTPGRVSALVSHLQVTRCMLSEALEIAVEEMTNLRIKTASITCIDYDESGTQTVHYQSFKPEAGLAASTDGGNNV